MGNFVQSITLLAIFAATSLSVLGQEKSPDKAPPKLKIFDDQPRLIFLAGGPQLTKEAEARRFIELVHRHYANKCPHQIEVLEREGKTVKDLAARAESVGAALTKARAKKLPIIVLAHLPPLATKPPDRFLVRDENDKERLKAYADDFAAYAQALHKHGADLVVLGAEGAVGPDKSDPKANGTFAHLHLVSDEIARRSLSGVAVGPRVFGVFDKNRHLYLKNDHHITAAGKRVVTQLWFQAICNLDGIPVPDWSRRELEGLLKK